MIFGERSDTNNSVKMLDNRQFSYNFDCNKVIESTKFKNSVTLYDRVNTQNVMTNAVVNLMPHMI